MFQDYVLIAHCFVFCILYAVKDDTVYSEKTQKRLNIATWVVGVPCFIFLAIFTWYLTQHNY